MVLRLGNGSRRRRHVVTSLNFRASAARRGMVRANKQSKPSQHRENRERAEA